MDATITDMPIDQFISTVSDHHLTLTGMVIAVNASQAAALGEACVQISLDNQIDTLDWQTVSQRVEKLAAIKKELSQWTNQEAVLIAQYLSYLDEPVPNASYRPLCETYTRISQLALEAANLLLDFRPAVYPEIAQDMDITIQLLLSSATSAAKLLQDKLQRWHDEALVQTYSPFVQQLEAQIRECNKKAP